MKRLLSITKSKEKVMNNQVRQALKLTSGFFAIRVAIWIAFIFVALLPSPLVPFLWLAWFVVNSFARSSAFRQFVVWGRSVISAWESLASAGLYLFFGNIHDPFWGSLLWAVGILTIWALMENASIPFHDLIEHQLNMDSFDLSNFDQRFELRADYLHVLNCLLGFALTLALLFL